MFDQLDHWLSRLTRRSHHLVGVLAAVGVVIALGILLWPTTGIPPELVERAQISTSIATVVALLAGIAAIGAAIWINGSDFQAEQKARADTAQVRASLRSIMVKSVHLQVDARSAVDNCVDFETERKVLSDFLSSTTAFGYWAWVEERSEKAGQGTEEDWRVFFLHVSRLLSVCKTPQELRLMMCRAAELENLLSRLEAKDIRRISSFAGNLTGRLGTGTPSGDSLLASVSAICARPEDMAARLQALKGELDRAGQSDPDLDLLVAVITNDVEAARFALEHGADPSVTDTAVLARHETHGAD